jgi:hypothetical protein
MSDVKNNLEELFDQEDIQMRKVNFVFGKNVRIAWQVSEGAGDLLLALGSSLHFGFYSILFG